MVFDVCVFQIGNWSIGVFEIQIPIPKFWCPYVVVHFHSVLQSGDCNSAIIPNSRIPIVQKNDCIQYYVQTSVLKWQFCGSRFLFSPRNLYFWFGFDLRNKNNIAVDNIFTLDSTLIPIVQLKVEKKRCSKMVSDIRKGL